MSNYLEVDEAARDKKLLDQLDALDRGEWMAIVRFMAPRLIDANQKLLLDAIGREAERRAESNRSSAKFGSSAAWFYLAEVFDHIGLKVEIATK